MSNMLQNCPFFGVPQVFVRGGQLRSVRPGAMKLYIALLHEAERYSRLELVRTDKEISELTGLSARCLRDSRTKLQEFGLIAFRLSHNGTVYSILDPRTAKPFRKKPQHEPPTGGTLGSAASPLRAKPEPMGVPLKFS